MRLGVRYQTTSKSANCLSVKQSGSKLEIRLKEGSTSGALLLSPEQVEYLRQQLVVDSLRRL
jgi:hypothetical protein